MLISDENVTYLTPILIILIIILVFKYCSAYVLSNLRIYYKITKKKLFITTLIRYYLLNK